ncbi:MAG: tripartite tricarboxylate transporter TctB family protein [Candidatus Methylomirabilota bacterium]
MRRADQVTAVVLFVGSLTLMREARSLQAGDTLGPGPEFLPFWLGVLMAGLAVMLFLQAWRRAPTEGASRVLPAFGRLVPIGATLLSLATYILVLEPLGFLLATGLLTAFLLGVVERERWTISLGVAVANAVVLHVIFRTLLGVSLPKGIWGF